MMSKDIPCHHHWSPVRSQRTPLEKCDGASGSDEISREAFSKDTKYAGTVGLGIAECYMTTLS
jgi:hypothetical protein